jgi:hypothetical protein
MDLHIEEKSRGYITGLNSEQDSNDFFHFLDWSSRVFTYNVNTMSPTHNHARLRSQSAIFDIKILRARMSSGIQNRS